MSMVKVSLKNDNFNKEFYRLEKRLDKLRELKELSAIWGWFDGENHTSSMEDNVHITLAYLAYIHHRGFTTPTGSNVPARPVLTISLHQLKDNNMTASMAKSLKKYLLDLLRRDNANAERALAEIAKIGKEIAQGIMGSELLESVTERTIALRKESKENAPLVDTGELRDKMKSRVIKTGKIAAKKVV